MAIQDFTCSGAPIKLRGRRFAEDMQILKGSQMFTLMCLITCEGMVEFGALDAAASTALEFRFVNRRKQAAGVSANLSVNEPLRPATLSKAALHYPIEP